MYVVQGVHQILCVFFKEFSKVCHPSLAGTRLLLCVVQKITNRSDCTLALRWELLKVNYSDVGEGGAAVNCEKNTIFLEHPVYNKEWGAIYSVTWICICLPVLHIDCWKVSLQPTSSHQPLSTGLSVGRFDIWSVVFFSLKGGGKLHFHAPIGALV